MNKYRVEAINLHVDLGQIRVTKIINAGNLESAMEEYYGNYLTIEILSITKIED